jgi:hypothetical protein
VLASQSVVRSDQDGVAYDQLTAKVLRDDTCAEMTVIPLGDGLYFGDLVFTQYEHPRLDVDSLDKTGS